MTLNRNDLSAVAGYLLRLQILFVSSFLTQPGDSCALEILRLQSFSSQRSAFRCWSIVRRVILLRHQQSAMFVP